MKKIISVFMIAICCLAIAMPAQAQLLKFGVKGGVNLSKLKLEGMKDNSTGFFFGPMAEVTIPIIGLGVDGAVLYSQKGEHDFKQSGLDIPINLKYSIGLGSMLGVYFAAGPDFYFDFKGDKNFADNIKLERKNAQVGLNLGAGLKLVKHLQVGFNYNIPFGDAFTRKAAGEAIGAKNKTWQVSAAYLF
ncbi:MAG: porin family protein [Bacteroides sp.]|nr:porin family protein [Bacteroides sp.]